MFTLTAWHSYTMRFLGLAEVEVIKGKAKNEDVSADKASAMFLKRVCGIYKSQISCISREISRRKTELEELK